jgi:excisionase family DNA binding protein
VIEIAAHFYTLTQAAERLGVERHTIWRWIKAGKLEAQRAGGVVFIEKEAVERLQRRVAS